MSSRIPPPPKASRPKAGPPAGPLSKPSKPTAASKAAPAKAKAAAAEAKAAPRAKAAPSDKAQLKAPAAAAHRGKSADPVPKKPASQRESRASTPGGGPGPAHRLSRKISSLSVAGLEGGASESFASRVSSHLSESTDRLPKGLARPKPLADATNSPAHSKRFRTSSRASSIAEGAAPGPIGSGDQRFKAPAPPKDAKSRTAARRASSVKADKLEAAKSEKKEAKAEKKEPKAEKKEAKTSEPKEEKEKASTPGEEKKEPPKAKPRKSSKRAVSSRLFASGTAATRQRDAARSANKDPGSKGSSSAGSEVGASTLTLASSMGTSGKHVSAAVYAQARKSGQINLANRALDLFPQQVFTYHRPTRTESYGVVDMGRAEDAEEDKWWLVEPLRRLLLPSNALTTIPDEIGTLETLQLLDVQDNQLREIPSTIGNLIRLQKLYLSRNELRDLPESLGELIDLRILSVSHNKLDVLPDAIGSLYYLEEVDASHNALTSVPSELTGWRVRTLNLSNNELLTLPKAIGWLQCLETLDLSSNQLSRLPPELGELQKLQTLQLSGNALLALPNLKDCISLKELLIAHNQLHAFPADLFENLPSLKVLDASHNVLSVFPASVLEVPGLERLNLSHNDLPEAPPELALLPTLKSLKLHDNPIRNVRKDILQRSTQAIVEYLKTRISDPDKLALLEADDRPLADKIGSPRAADAIAARRLDLSGRKLEDLPEAFIERLAGKDIASVDLAGNDLSRWPPRLLDFAASLQSLDLSRNKLSAVPPEVGELRWLRSLRLDGNLLSDLPAELAFCTQLYELHLAQNRIAVFPAVIYELRELEVLGLGGNKISGWDSAAFAQLEVLHTVDLTNNEILHVPPELGLMSLRSVALEGNPFRIPRNDLLVKGTAEVLRYLRSRLPQPTGH